jgi:hypothetical protein
VITRFLLFVERVGRTKLLLAAAGVVVLVVAGVVLAFARPGGGGDKSSKSTQATTNQEINLYYVRATAPKVSVSGCTMRIRFVWKPDYHADQYVGYPALITTRGPGIEGTTRKRFTKKGVSIEVGPVSIAGGYKLWAARVVSIDGDPPGNDTTIQAAPPTTTKCR